MTTQLVVRDDRGLAESASWALLMPLLLAIILAIVSVGSWTHARMGASTAAAVAADHMASFAGDEPTATKKATRIADQAGLRDVAVTITTTATDVTVTVAGRAALPVDIGVGMITERAQRPRERISAP